MALDCEVILKEFICPRSELWGIVMTHSQCVAELATKIAEFHAELHIDIDFVREAAWLHDIGVVWTDAPSIDCHGSYPYICHGILGRAMLDSIGLHRHAMVCERHTGAGLTAGYIAEAGLPLPRRDMTPQTIEEKIVCYADKFFSKSKNLTEQKSLERAFKSVSKYGEDSRKRFEEMDALLRIPQIG